MQLQQLARGALSICAIMVTFPGCGGTQSVAPPGTPVVFERTAKIHRSRIDFTATGQNLLYISSEDRGSVYVYSYPQGALVGTLTGFLDPLGECTDAAGDVFVVASANASGSSSTIYEYAHGGTTPIAMLSDPSAGIGCSVDPTTGNLAVAGNGVAVYQHASGSPKMYHSSRYVILRSCGYDNLGNLYLSTDNSRYSSQAQLLRLAPGSSDFQEISLDAKLYTGTQWPSIQRRGTNLMVTSNPFRKPIALYRLRLSGSTATVVGTTTLSTMKNYYFGQVWIQAQTIIGVGMYKRGYQNAFLWPYPKGGGPSKSIKKVGNIRQILWGVTVSLAKER